MDRSSLLVFKAEVTAIVRSCLVHNFSICARCILRYCNSKHVFTQCTHQEMVNDLAFLLGSGSSDSDRLSEVVDGFCASCLNLLRDTFAVEKSKQILDELTKNEYNSVDQFQLQIHIPVVVTLRNNYYLKKFNLENNEIMSIKEVLKVLMAIRLGKLLGVKHRTDSNFIIGERWNFKLEINV